MMKIQIKLSQSDIRRNAMVDSGLNPQLMAVKRPSQRQRDRKSASRAGYAKHKGRSFD
jgi:hypothetical protein